MGVASAFRYATAAVALLAAPAAAQKRQPNPPPVFVPTPPVVRTQQATETYGAWTVSRLGTYYLASTRNASESVLGVACDQECLVLFNPRISCDKGDEYPALANSPAGAFPMTLRCTLIDGRNILGASLPDLLVDSFEIGGELGVAFPMQSGQFQVTRFSLTGAMKAAARAYGLSTAGRNGRSEELRDQRQ